MTIRSSIEEAVGREDFAAVLTLCNELELEVHSPQRTSSTPPASPLSLLFHRTRTHCRAPTHSLPSHTLTPPAHQPPPSAAQEHAAPPQDRSAMFVSVHLMAYYIANDRLNARYLWKRTPIDLKENAEVAAAWEVGKAMWARDSGRVHAALDAFAWSDPLVSALVPALKENIRARTLKLLATAYSSLSVDAAKTHLGVDTDDCLKRTCHGDTRARATGSRNSVHVSLRSAVSIYFLVLMS